MLVSLRISNFVLIEDSRIELHPGLNVLTGETGAGKSVIIGALSLLLGERGSAEAVRNPGQEAAIEAVFELDPASPLTREIQAILEQSGLALEENCLIVTRRISGEGRSRTFINNSQCLLKCLKEISAMLVDLHGQHEHQSLFNKSSYQSLLDGFGDGGDLLTAYRAAYRRWTETREALRNLEEDARERKRREDSLRYQMEEIDSASLTPGEDEEIANTLSVLQHAERLGERCNEIINTLSDGEVDTRPLLDRLGHIELLLDEMTKWDASLAPVLESFQPAVIALQEVCRDLQSYSLSLEFNPDELETLQQRKFLIKDLKSKYGESIEDILAYRETVAADLERIEGLDEEREILRQQEETARMETAALGQKLHKKREDTAKKVSQKVTAELKGLGMEQAKFQIDVRWRENAEGVDVSGTLVAFGPSGGDDIEFLISTIPDRPPRPLREIASGGEISRVMLGLKCTFGQSDPVPTMIFDEIDVGVGGKTADAVAERMAALAREKQVLCITHLAQIASRADQNLCVSKAQVDSRLVSQVTILKGKEREKELARMLGGEDNAASQRFARELLKAGRK